MSDDLVEIWSAAQAQLPSGWKLDSLRCASESLRLEDRSDDWIAVAIGFNAKESTCRAPNPTSALDGLVAVVRSGVGDNP